MAEYVKPEPAGLDTLVDIANRGYSRPRVFRDWLDLMLSALQRDDEQYMPLVEKYDDRDRRDHPNRTIDLFKRAFHELQEEMARTNADVLGEIYMEYGISSDDFGQHFTPHNVVKFMGSLVGSSDDGRIHDPACGSGRMLIVPGQQADDV